MRPDQIVPFVSSVHARPWHLHLRSVSVNVQAAVGKHPLLEQQFELQHIAVAFLQKTKEKGGLVESARFLRYGSHPEIHWGVAIWISRTVPVGWDGSRPIFVDAASVNVISSGPRHLVMSATVNSERFCLTSAHFPHQGRPESERKTLHEEIAAAVSCSWGVMPMAGLLHGIAM